MAKSRLIDDYKITQIINYLRRSRQDEEREKRTGEDTLSEQKQLMDRVLADYGVPYDQRMEIGSGDKISTRPVFQEVLDDLRSGKYDAIAVKELSRLGRGSYTDMGQIYDLLREHRIYIITPWRVYDPMNESDKRQIRFELFLSREEFETTRERLMGARYNYAMQGKWMAGTVPYGYSFDQQSQRLVPVDEEAKIVRMIFEFYVAGIEGKEVGPQAIATYLNRLGIKSPRGKGWSAQVIRRMLVKHAYSGQVRFRITERKGGTTVLRPQDEWIIVDHAHEAIIDDETWYATQEKYTDVRKHLPRTKLDFSPCELAGLLKCEKCGHRMVRQYNVQHYKKQDGTESVYEKEFLWCKTRGCTFVKYRDVEAGVLLMLSRFRDATPEGLRAALQDMAKNVRKESIGKAELIMMYETRKKEVESRLAFIFEKLEARVYTEDEFLKRKAFHQKELDQIQANLTSVLRDESEEPQERSFDEDFVRNHATKILSIYENLQDKSAKNLLLRGLFEEIGLTVLEKGRGRRPAIFDLDPKLKQNFLIQS